MSRTRSTVLQALLGLALLFCCLVVLQSSPRAIGAILLLVLIPCYIRYLFTSKTKLLRSMFVAFLITVNLPVDISLQNYPGPPRFVPLIMGMPRPEDFARQERGEVVLGGCIMRDNPPKWILVW